MPCIGLTMWPCKQASDWKFKHEAAPCGGKWAPWGEKCIKKKETYCWTLQAFRGVSVLRPPPTMWTFWCKNKKLNSPSKNISTQAQLWQELVGSKASFRLIIRAQNLMQDSVAPYLRINNSTQAQLWPGLAGKLQSQDSSSQSDAWHNILILMNFFSKQAQHRPDHVALQASYKLEFWTHNLMQDTTSSY
jgi:hypothetical protein